jgi:hypothetical protein
LIGPSTRNGPFGRTVIVTSPSAMLDSSSKRCEFQLSLAADTEFSLLVNAS